MKDYKGMDMGQYRQDRYMDMIKGDKGAMKIMGHASKVHNVDADAQKFDMKRANWLAKEKRGYDNKAWEYKY